MDVHDAANIFPLDEERIAELAKDIRENGQQVPIELLGGKIIDGRRRHKACLMAGAKPITRDVKVDDPVAYVLSLNLHRLHLTPSQMAMVGDSVREIYEKQAKERMSAGGKAAGKGRPQQGKESLPSPMETGQARDLAGKAVGVSGKLIDYARKVRENAVPEVVKAVEEGRMAVSTAAILSSEPEEKQRQEAESPKRQRDYRSVSKVRNQDSEEEEPNPQPESNGSIKSRGVGVECAHEAINCLARIPKNDQLRKRGFQIVTDWIKRNP